MGKFLNVVGRYGPLAAALVVGIGGVVTTFYPEATGIVTLLTFLLRSVGVGPDAAVSAEFSNFVVSALLAYGGARKLINVVRDAVAKAKAPAEAPPAPPTAPLA